MDWKSLWGRRWFRLSLAGVVLVVLYAFVGFFVVPWIAKPRIIAELSRRTGQTATLEELNVNPFIFTVEAKGFALDDATPPATLEFERLFVDFELSSIFQGAFVFRELDLRGPALRAHRFENGSVDLLQILASVQTSFASNEPAPEAETEPFQTPSILVQRLAVSDGAVALRDDVTQPSFSSELAPLSFELLDLDTRPGHEGRHTFTAYSEAGERFSWSGGLSFQPLVATGSVAVAGLQLPKYDPYVSSLAPIVATDGKLDADIEYEAALTDSGPRLRLTAGRLRARDAALRIAEQDQDFVSVSALDVDGASFAFPDMKATVGRIAVRGGGLSLWVDSELRTSIDPLLRFAEGAGSSPEVGPTMLPVSIELGGISVADFVVDGAHRTRFGNVPVRLDARKLDLGTVRIPVTDSSTVSVNAVVGINRSGSLKAQGQVTPWPLKAQARVELSGLNLADFQPYVADVAQLELKSGRLSVDGRVRGTADPAPNGTFEGNIRIDEVRTTEVGSDRDFARVQSLAIRGLQARMDPLQARVKELEVDAPYAVLVMRKDGSLNLERALRPPQGGDSIEELTEDVPLPDVWIEKIVLSDAGADVRDLTVDPPFRISVQRFRGQILDLTTTDLGRGRFRLKGTIDRQAPVQLSGSLRPFATRKPTTVALAFENLGLTSFTPYSGKYAGWAIAQGKLGIDVEYTLLGTRIDGRNEVIVDQMKFGERVDSPDALKLPVKLGVALLKDKNGVIDLDIPVSGDLEDPEFKVGKIIWKTVLNNLEKAALSPFKAIGGLFSAKDEKARVPFVVGTATTTPAVSRDVRALEEQLAQRPAIVLEITGEWDPKQDRDVLARKELDRLLARFQEREDVPSRDLPADPEAPRAHLIRDAYRRATAAEPFTSTSTTTAPLADRVLRHWPGAKPDPEAPPRWLSAPVQDLEQELVDQIQVPTEKLRALAEQRARAMRDALVQAGRIEPGRIFVLAVQPGQAGTRLRLDAR